MKCMTQIVRAIQYWFTKFRKGNFNPEDAERSGLHPVLNSDDLRTVVNANPFQSCQNIAQTINSSTSTVFQHLKEIGKVSKFVKWVPHQLTEKQQIERVNIANSLLTRQHAVDFLDKDITGDEKWILYEDNKRKRYWLDADDSGKLTAKNDLYPKKGMIENLVG